MSDVNEAKVDAGKSPETKEKERNVRKFGVSHNVAGHGKLRRALHRSDRGHKKIKGDKPQLEVEGMIASVKKGVKRHKDAVQKKKEREGKAVNYAMLAQEYVPEEGYDHMRDKALERGTWKEPERKNPPRKPQTDADKKKSKENSQKALDIVKNNILKKYGKGAIWEPKTQKEGIEDIIARLEKKRISKGGNPDESPLGKKTGRAMKSQQDKARKKTNEGKEYGLYKGDGKAKGAMKDFLDKKAAKLKKEKDKQSAPYKNNPAFGDASHHSNAKNRTEGLKTWKKFLEEGNRTSRQLTKSKTQTTGNISADRGDDEKKNRSSRKGLEKDLKKKGIGYSKGVGEYAYKSDGGKEGTKKEVSYQTTPAKGMSKRRFGKVMRRLGRKHGQESVITKDKDKPARLHDTQNKKPDKSFALGKSKPGKNPSKQGETSGTKVRSGKLPSKTKGAMHYGN